MMSFSRLARVVCSAPAQDSLAALYEALGSTIENLDNGLLVHVSGGCIEYHWGAERRGVVALEIIVDDVQAQRRQVTAMGIATTSIGAASAESDGFLVQANEAGGIEVKVLPGSDSADTAGPDCPIRLDHVALAVEDVDDAARRWQALTGVRAHMMGLHPVSNGAFSAARHVLGEQMIELVSPTVGHDSALARRLAAKGEGPVGVAAPVADVEAAIGRLDDLGVELIRTAPHVMLHPRDTGGVVMQLTPRVNH